MVKARLIAFLVGVLVLSSVACEGQAGPSAAPGLERQAITSFTRQALEIEAKRSDVVEYFAGLAEEWGWGGMSRHLDMYLLVGFSEDSAALYDMASPLEGMLSLHQRLLFLGCPPALRSIKDGLLYLYATEIELARLEEQLNSIRSESSALENKLTSGWTISSRQSLVCPSVTKDTVADWEETADWMEYRSGVCGQWGRTQELRLDIYTHWAGLLQEHGIDPTEEGFAELVGQ